MNSAVPEQANIILEPASRRVRLLTVSVVLAAIILLAFGGFVTSFRVGMSDPVWPTEPWYLANNFKPDDVGYLIEHTHRILGFLVGATATILAFAAWRGEPNRSLRRGGMIALVALLVGYGWFHGGMRQVSVELKTIAENEYRFTPGTNQFEAVLAEGRLIDRVRDWPYFSGTLTLLAALTVIGCGAAAGFSGQFGGWFRAWSLIALVALMTQGLLGGFRVLLNAQFGTDLAALHGAFGQITFCTLIAVLVYAEPRRYADALDDELRPVMIRMTGWLVGLLGLQLLIAVILRHTGDPSAQRLHILTAFAITGYVAWLVLKIQSSPKVKAILGRSSVYLFAILVLQVLLGVEAYLGKFAAFGPQAQVLPEARIITGSQAFLRTLHQLVGCGLLASAVALAIRASRRPEVLFYTDVLESREVPPVASLALDHDATSSAEIAPPPIAAMALEPPQGGHLR